MRQAILVIVTMLVISSCGESRSEPTPSSASELAPTSESASTLLTTTAPASTTIVTADSPCRGCAEPPDIPVAQQRESTSGWVESALSPGTYATRVFEVPLSFTIDGPVKTLGESTSWIALTFSMGQHFIDFWGSSALSDINPVEWIRSQAAEGEGVRLLDVRQTELFGRPATQIDLSITEILYLVFADEAQHWRGRTRVFVTEVDGRPLLVAVSGFSCAPFPLCSADDEEANEYQFQKHLARSEDLLASVTVGPDG